MASGFKIDGTDFDDYFEPLRSGFTTQTSDTHFQSDSTNLTNIYLRKDYCLGANNINDFSQFAIFNEDIASYTLPADMYVGFTLKGYAPAWRNGVQIEYMAGPSGTIDRSDLSGVSGADFLDFDTNAINLFMVSGGGNGANGGSGNGTSGGGGGGGSAVFVGKITFPEGYTTITYDVGYDRADTYIIYNYLSTNYGIEPYAGVSGSGRNGGAGGSDVYDTWYNSGIAKVSGSVKSAGVDGGDGGTATISSSNNGSDGGNQDSSLDVLLYDLLGDGTENGGLGWDYIEAVNSSTTNSYDITHGHGGDGGTKYASGYPTTNYGGGGGGGGAGFSIGYTANGGDGNSGNPSSNYCGAGGGGGRGYVGGTGATGSQGLLIFGY